MKLVFINLNHQFGLNTKRGVRVAEAKLAEGRITDEALLNWTERIGVKLRIHNVFNTLASKDAIRKFADGIGDINPLWRNENYANKTRYRKIVAPPSWLYSVFPTWVLQGLQGVHAFHSGNDWTFHKPVFVNDKITPECIFTGFDVKRSKFAGKMVRELQRANFYNQKGELVASTDLWLIRAERNAARKKGKYSKIQLPHPWTEEELSLVEEDVLSGEIRGSEPRYWEDVEVGEKLKPEVKGPFGLTDMIAYCLGAAPVEIKAFRSSLELYRKHPAWAFRDPNTYSLEPVYSVHYNKHAANAAGLPYPYDVGVQRQSWLMNLLTNWMGDDGWLKRNYAEYRKFVFHSDVIWFMGMVTRKYIDKDGEPCVDIETHGINQRGEDTMPGYSTVVLPSKEKRSWPLDKRVNA